MYMSAFKMMTRNNYGEAHNESKAAGTVDIIGLLGRRASAKDLCQLAASTKSHVKWPMSEVSQ